jgi:hypothetical protein
MAVSYKLRLFLRLLALGVLTLCLAVLTRSGSNAPLASTEEPLSSSDQTPAPAIAVRSQPETPLFISSVNVVSSGPGSVEFTYSVTNASAKPVRAYAIKLEDEEGGVQVSSVTLYSLELTRSAMQPNESEVIPDGCDFRSGKVRRVVLSVDYVEFEDGTKWGADSTKSSERLAGQRAAAHAVSKRLLQILSSGNPADVVSAIEAGVVNVEPPPGRSEEWTEGFRVGRNSVTGQLKRAQTKGGLGQIEIELQRLAEKVN